MRIEQTSWTPGGGWSSATADSEADLLLVFGHRSYLRDPDLMTELQRRWPQATQLGCSTAGEILDVQVHDGTVTATAVRFESSRVVGHWRPLPNAESSAAVGARLASDLDPDGLRHVLVISNGIDVNGTALVRGLTENLPAGVSVTGGLAGDGADFHETLVVAGGEVGPRRAAVVGLYGPQLAVGYGSLGGWDPFGPERVITRSSGNVLYELDGQSALELYRRYLGEHASDLPASGLLFPLAVRDHGREESVVRTILSIDPEEQSMTFAGDLPEGSYARLMRANFDRLIDGAQEAARRSVLVPEGQPPQLALLISCVGRKMVLQQRVEEEVEAVREILGTTTPLTGFYSYGEISPLGIRGCELHNQTMTITTLAEIPH